MPFLVLNSNTVPVAAVPVEAEYIEYGDGVAAHSGTWLTRTRARKRTWPVQTVWLSVSAAATLRTVLFAPAPHVASGDMVGGTVSVVVQVQGEASAKFGGTPYFQFRFALVEA
jgi:hypothetical protein